VPTTRSYACCERVLSELEIGMELCADAESAIHKLTRRRFEAVIVDCGRPTHRLACAPKRALRTRQQARRSRSHPRRPDGELRAGADLGAHFVLHQPLSPERAKTSFRAVRALMKRERRRNARIPVETPVTIQVNDGAGQLRAVTTDLGGRRHGDSTRPPPQEPGLRGFTVLLTRVLRTPSHAPVR